RRAAHGQAVGGRLLAPAGEARQAHAPAGGTAPAGGSAGSGPVRLKGPDGRLVAVADPVETPQGVAFRPRIVRSCKTWVPRKGEAAPSAFPGPTRTAAWALDWSREAR